MYMFMSDKRRKLLAGCMLEMLEHSSTGIRAEALDTLKSAIIRDQDGGTTQMKEIILAMAPILEMAEEHKEKVLAHDLAGCD
jgi:hypothetical protein